MSEYRVLHVTDFHIENPEAADEYLRHHFYREYLENLKMVFDKAGAPAPDAIVATGDFVNKGNVEHFDHAQVVLAHLADQFGMSVEQVATCIGNHDYILGHERSGDTGEARRNYLEFQNPFANGAKLVQRFGDNDAIVVCEPREGLWCVMVDATCGGEPEMPGRIDTRALDEFIRMLREDESRCACMVIGAHYPILLPMESFGDALSKEDDYKERHFWTHGKLMVDRIVGNFVRQGGRVLWLSGDVHEPSIHVDRDIVFVSTGRLGTAANAAVTPIYRQARIVEISESIYPIRTWTATLDPLSHWEHAAIGKWSCNLREDRGVGSMVELHETDGGRAAESEDSGLVSAAKRPQLVDLPLGSEAEDSELQRSIISTIEEGGFYRLGRFSTSENEICLSWVPIGLLMNRGSLTSTVCGRMAEWLRQCLTAEEITEGKDADLLGIDCWGAVMAAQLAIQTGIGSFCVAARGRGLHSVEHEIVDQDVCAAVHVAKCVVLVSDVVATGRSLVYVYEDITRRLGADASEELVWIALSVICDEQSECRADLTFLSEHGSACRSLPMPIVLSERLPAESILPADLSFTREM